MSSSNRETGFEPRIGRSVSIDHAAELLGVSRRTIYNRIRDGRLQTVRTLGGSQRVTLESVGDLGGRRPEAAADKADKDDTGGSRNTAAGDKIGRSVAAAAIVALAIVVFGGSIQLAAAQDGAQAPGDHKARISEDLAGLLAARSQAIDVIEGSARDIR